MKEESRAETLSALIGYLLYNLFLFVVHTNLFVMSAFTPTVGIVGATGAVGLEVISCLHRRSFPLPKKANGSLADMSLRLFASPRSAGKVISTPFGDITVEAFSVDAARECRFIFLAVSGDFALEHARAITATGSTIVIDNSSAFRYMDDIPLVVPEINAHALKGASLIANPNCTTASKASSSLYFMSRSTKPLLTHFFSCSSCSMATACKLWY